MSLSFGKKSIYIFIFIGFSLVGVFFSLYASYEGDEILEKEENILIRDVIEKEKNIDDTTGFRVVEEEKKDENTQIKQIKFTAKQNKRFLNLTKKARDELKEQGIDIFIKLPKQYFHCNKFGCYLNYTTFSESKKKHFVVKEINSETGEKKSTVYIVSYDLKDKGFDITSKLERHTIQNRSLSCESSSAADIISHLTKTIVGENEIIEKIKGKGVWFNKLPIPDNSVGKTYWGDPDVGFVGFINDYEEVREIEEENVEEIFFESDLSELDELDKLEVNQIKEVKTEIVKVKARQHSMNGYGVYEKPFISVYSSYGLNAQIINKYNYKEMGLNSKSHLKKLLIELKKGNMVQLWGDYCTLKEFEDGTIAEKDVRKKESLIESGKVSSKNTCANTSSKRTLEWYIKEDGKDRFFTGLSGEHNFYLLGYTGNINHPTGIIVWDTYTGKHTYPAKEWYRKWKLMQNRSIIVSKK